MSKTNFIWAQSLDANVREPLKELAEKGWQHRDIPKASNMNWIFKQISDEFLALRKDMEQKAEELKGLLVANSNEIQKHQNAIAKLKNEQKSLSEDYDSLESYTEQGLGRACRGDNFNRDISRQICMLLREMERCIKHYHRDFPSLPWPLNNNTGESITTTAEDESIG